MSWSEKQLFDSLSDNLDSEDFKSVSRLRNFLISRGGRYRRGVARTLSGRYELPITDSCPPLVGFYTWAPEMGRNDRFAIGFMNLRDRVERERLQQFWEDLMKDEAYVPKLKDVPAEDFNKYPEFDIDGVLNAPGAVETLESAIDRLLRN